MGTGKCFGGASNYMKLRRHTTNSQLSSTFTLIWLDDEQKKNIELKNCLKQIDQRIIKLDDSDLCETYIKTRPNDHFILIVCYKFANILVPEIDELPQLDSVFIYDFLSADLYKSWMKQCRKIINEVFSNLDQLENSVKDRTEFLKKTMTTKSEISNVNDNLRIISSTISLRSNTDLITSHSNIDDSDTHFYLIWLDINASTDERTKDEIKSYTTCQLLTFDNVNDCEQYVFSHPNARFIFIVSYELGYIITPKVVSLKQTITIFVYSTTIEKTDASWITQYHTKVQPVVEDLAILKSMIPYEFQKCGLNITFLNIILMVFLTSIQHQRVTGEFDFAANSD